MAPDRQGLSKIPSMTVLLRAAASAEGLRDLPDAAVADALREAVESLRRQLLDGNATEADCQIEAVLSRARAAATARRANRLTRVINATGVVLHTGLGRSALSEEAVERIGRVARGYCSLEIVLETGKRGQRGQYAERLLCQLTGAEAALIVNNNAAATMLALNGLAKGREVVVSRGQLIEIGGSFRLPEVMTAGGAILREVGTTNKTHLRDYEAAIDRQTAMLMHVHTSNYRVVGFSASPGVEELARLAHDRGLVMFDDLGSGALLDDALWAAADEPTVVASLKSGADLVTFSGDKLLGGPQAGVLLGRREIVDRLRHDPMARALRIDKLTIAALEVTLELYQSPDTVKQHVPLLASLSALVEALTTRAEALASLLRKAMPDESFEVARDESFAGGGSLPAWPLATAVVRWQPASGTSLDEIARRLRLSDPSVLPRIREGAILFDLRTIAECEFDELASAVTTAAKEGRKTEDEG
ncbi:MAG: L-seryl-tRNA(Sec) selenium transferase [Phycisphaerae bacterium]|nr:L-seryl-tRNA(Sec) selenium transferase [Phycisphaerae bacterium]